MLKHDKRLTTKQSLICISIATVCLLFGIYIAGISYYQSTSKWIVLCIAIYTIPVLFTLMRTVITSTIAMWLMVILIGQSLLSPLTLGAEHHKPKTLYANIDTVLNFPAEFTGVSGPQHITTDNQGFRVVPQINYKDKKEIRIFTIGGSTIEQIILGDKKTTAYLLQEAMNKKLVHSVSVINAGVSGLRALHHIHTLKHILQYHPDYVLFLIGTNDWGKHISEAIGKNTSPPHFYFTNSMLGLVLSNLYYKYAAVHLTKITPNVGKNPWDAVPVKTKTYLPKDVLQSYKQELKKISAICKQNKITCVFLTQPTRALYQGNDEVELAQLSILFALEPDSMNYIANLYNNYLISFAIDNQHPVIDLAQQLAPTSENMYDSVHHTEKGASNIAKYLTGPMLKIVNDDQKKTTALGPLK